MSEFIVSIPHTSLVDCVTRINQLGCILGENCRISPDNALMVDLNWIDDRIVEELERSPDPTPEPVPTLRIDRELQIDDESKQQILLIEVEYSEAYTAADGNYDRARQALKVRARKIEEIRNRIVKQFIPFDIEGNTLIYGDGHFDGALTIPFPDGRHRQVRTLIHYTHPRCPEELAIRERRIQAERIIRYRVPGLDDAAWMRQNQPCSPLDARRLREVICGY